MVNSWLYSVHILLYFIESVATSNWSKHSMKYSTSVIKTEWTCTFLCKLTVLWWKRKRNSVILAILFSLCHWIIFVFAKWCYKQHPGHWFRIAQYQPQFIQDLLIFAFLEGEKKISADLDGHISSRTTCLYLYNTLLTVKVTAGVQKFYFFIAHPENAKIKFFLPGPEALLEARTLSSTIDKPYVLFGTPFICWSEVGKDCARESPPKTRYSGHSYSRLMRDMTKHNQTDRFSYYMREGWKSMKERS